jgi:hypothetical protein
MDEHVPKAVTEGLRRRGVDVITVQELGLQAAEDARHLERAATLSLRVFAARVNTSNFLHALFSGRALPPFPHAMAHD